MDYCEIERWDDLIEASNASLPMVPPMPPFFVMGGTKLKPKYQLDPLVTVALLARTAQKFMFIECTTHVHL